MHGSVTDRAGGGADSAVPALIAVDWGTSSFRAALTDASGRHIDNLDLTGRLQRTVTDKEDQVLAFGWVGSGAYTAPARLAPGLWEVEVHGTGDGVADYHKIFRFVVKAE